MIKDKIEYFLMLLKLFAQRYGLDNQQAYDYISKYNGVEYVEQHYNILHTLSFRDMVDSLTAFCHKNGGNIQ
ncbi:MAG: DUF3791 domain-containing protein [Bacteroidales bacterium]|nr:DUF3791 domain-containing protein [Bacteroidales bacterium]